MGFWNFEFGMVRGRSRWAPQDGTYVTYVLYDIRHSFLVNVGLLRSESSACFQNNKWTAGERTHHCLLLLPFYWPDTRLSGRASTSEDKVCTPCTIALFNRYFSTNAKFMRVTERFVYNMSIRHSHVRSSRACQIPLYKCTTPNYTITYSPVPVRPEFLTSIAWEFQIRPTDCPTNLSIFFQPYGHHGKKNIVKVSVSIGFEWLGWKIYSKIIFEHFGTKNDVVFLWKQIQQIQNYPHRCY